MTYADALSRDVCEPIVERFENDARQRPSRTATTDTPKVRTGTQLEIPKFPEWRDVVELVDATIRRHMPDYVEKFPGVRHLAHPDSFTITKALIERIEPGQGYGYHIDAGHRGPIPVHDHLFARRDRRRRHRISLPGTTDPAAGRHAGHVPAVLDAYPPRRAADLHHQVQHHELPGHPAPAGAPANLSPPAAFAWHQRGIMLGQTGFVWRASEYPPGSAVHDHRRGCAGEPLH